MSFSRWVAAFLLISVSSAYAEEIPLPANIRTYLAQHYPMDPVYRSAQGDFNGDHKPDYALILKPDDCDPTYYCTTLLTALSSGTTTTIYRMFANPGARYCNPLEIRPAGPLPSLEGDLTLAHAAIGCGKEGSYVVIWWDGQDFKESWLKN